MRNFFIFLLFTLVPIGGVSQNTNLTFTAQSFWNDAKSLLQKAQSKEDYLNAIKDFEKVKSLCPNFPDTYYNLARLYLEVADTSKDYYSKAARSIEKYAFLVPEDENIQDLANDIRAKIKENGISDVSINLSSSTKIYRVGDLFYSAGAKGIVCHVDENGLHGIAVSVEESTGNYDSAVKWIAQNFTGRWTMPTKKDMDKILDNMEALQVFLVRNNCNFKQQKWYWATTQVTLFYNFKDSEGKVWRRGTFYLKEDTHHLYVRAIYKF